MAVSDSIASALSRFGQAGAIRRTTISGGVPWDPNSGTSETLNYDCTLAVMNYAKRELNSTLILASDRKVFISTEGLDIPALPDRPDSLNAPDVADKLVIGSAVFEIVTVMPRVLSGAVLVFEVQARS